ncbi:RDD family protein [Rhizobium tropici]|uniref:RDD family protein n=1 Tax=Rhizobium tropici TaxID=398 RepID=A0A5B0W7R3_RHITR|nr:RDD family protein [Rhizobium tropici]KAA1182445.1 RDD family protein [Rhizobium tropici]
MRFRRILAGLVDLILLVFMALAPTFAADAWFPEYMDSPAGQPPTPLMGATLLWLMITLLFYFPAFESSMLQATPGKLLFGLKVALPNGDRLSFVQAFYRMVFGPLAIWYLPSYRRRFSGDSIVTYR